MHVFLIFQLECICILVSLIQAYSSKLFSQEFSVNCIFFKMVLVIGQLLSPYAAAGSECNSKNKGEKQMIDGYGTNEGRIY